MLVFLWTVAIALFISSLCSVAEAALLSLTPAQLSKIEVSHPNEAAIWQRFKKNIDYPISTILFFNTAAHTIGASVAGAQFDQLYGGSWVLIFSIVLTFIMLQYTEIAPKTLGVRYNYKIAIIIAKPLDFIIRVSNPILKLLHFLNRPFSKGMTSENGGSIDIIDEINSLVKTARLNKIINHNQENIINKVSALNELGAKKVMIPIESVVFLNTNQTIAEAMAVVQNDPHTRFPVCKNGNKDAIVGYVNFKEMAFHAWNNPEQKQLQPIRPIKFIPSSISSESLLKIFVTDHAHMAIVQDNLGKTLGLITLEDIVEELVGDLEDEFDKLPKMLHGKNDNVWIAGGGLLVSDLQKKLKINMSNQEETVSDWIICQLKKTPKKGDSLDFKNYVFFLSKVRRDKIFEVIISPRTPSGH